MSFPAVIGPASFSNYKASLVQQTNHDYLHAPIQTNVDEENSIRQRAVVPVADPNPLITVFGPKIDRGLSREEPQDFSQRICAQTISTYPKRSDHGVDGARDGDPVCDRYGYYLFSNRSIVSVCDGCNWGELPKRAAERARNSVMGYLKEKGNKIRTVDDAKLYLLRSLNEAHCRICDRSSPEEDVGSTTVIAGLGLEIEGASSGAPSEWAFVCVSVGDCKAFLINNRTKLVRDITINNRTGNNASDCGGRLGPVMPDGGPDLRNLKTYSCKCNPGDMVVVVSDGVHDNLHPHMLNIVPRDLRIDYPDWETASASIDVDKIVSNFRVKFLADLLAPLEEWSPSTIVSRLIEFSNEITKSSREFMETNPGKRLPRDYHLYPGKMDHTTTVVFRIGRAETLFLSPILKPKAANSFDLTNATMPCIPISVTVSISDDHLSLFCRTIAKGKFECLAKKTECVLTVSPRKSFTLKEGEEIIGTDELSTPISRVIKIPEHVSINIHSKQISYNADVGIISIRFALAK